MPRSGRESARAPRGAALAVFVLLTAVPARSQYFFDYPKYRKFEASVFVYAWRPMNFVPSTYADAWHDRLLLSVSEQTEITGRPFGLGAGGSAAFFFDRTWGIQVMAETASAAVTTSADVRMDWTWADNRSIRERASWPGTGRLTSVPLSLNAVFRVSSFFHSWTFSGGITSFRTRFEASSWFAFGVSKMNPDESAQLMDALKVGLRVPPRAWWSRGVNFGIGYAFDVSDRLALKLEVRGYYSPPLDLRWTFVQGLYDGYFYGELRGEPFLASSVDFVTQAKTLSDVRVRPSSLRLSVGLAWSSRPVVED